MEILYGCPFEKITFLPRIDTNSGFEGDWDTLWKKFSNGTFIPLQMKVFDHKIFQIPCTESKVPNWQFLKWHFRSRAWNLKIIVAKCLHLKCYECAINFFSITCLSLFQIQNLCQFWAKRWFSQKDTHTAFPFFFLVLSC